MISFMKGTIAQKTNFGILLEVGFIGYEIMMPTCALAELAGEGDKALVHTYLHIRENELSLYGFTSAFQREIFLKLIDVNGVGPKVALAALSALDPYDLMRAIVSEDYATIASVPGIGKKTAQRIALDLKDKFAQNLSADFDGVTGRSEASTSAFGDARMALESMGFVPLEVSKALKAADKHDDVTTIIEKALKELAH